MVFVAYLKTSTEKKKKTYATIEMLMLLKVYCFNFHSSRNFFTIVIARDDTHNYIA